MTNVGVDAAKPERVDALWMNSYNYRYHSFKQKQLCDYFDCYRSRAAPHFRRTCVEKMRNDCQSYKEGLATFPGRTLTNVNTTAGLEPMARSEATSAPATQSKPRIDFLVRPRISAKDYSRWRFETTPVVTTQARAEWVNILNRCPERFDIQLPEIAAENGAQKPYFDGGYGLRYLRPHMTRGLPVDRYSERFIGDIVRPSTNSPFRDIRVVSPFATYG